MPFHVMEAQKTMLFVIVTSICLAIIVVLITIHLNLLQHKRLLNPLITELDEEYTKKENWIKCISTVCGCLALCVAGTAFYLISIRIDGNNNRTYIAENMTVNYNPNSPDSETIKEKPAPDYNTVDSWVVGWSDSNGGRDSYTIEEINKGVLDNAVVLNSISNSGIGHEFNFVGARENSDNAPNYYNANEIGVEKDKTYTVRLYIHNNSRIESNVAEDVKVKFAISEPKYVINDKKYEVAVHGNIYSSNANPRLYSDGVKFVSEKPFKLVYTKGTASLVNQGIARKENGNWKLDDMIVDEWVTIGYDNMDGRIPACYHFEEEVSIIVMPVFE